MKIQLTLNGSKKIKQGYPLIQLEDLVNPKWSNDWVELMNPQGEYIGTGYLGKQNKGIGWVLTRKKTPIDDSFFQALFEQAKKKRQPYYLDPLTSAFRLFNGEGDGLGG